MPIYTQKGNEFALEGYDKAEHFTDFLSGIAGECGIPMWAFIVNRGQCISSFGVGDKNGAILEFLPANKAFANVRRSGFRTFIKYNGKLIEAFQDIGTVKTYKSNLSTLIISEVTADFEIEVVYTTMCQEKIPALLRKVTIRNTSQQEIDLELLDGLSQLLPYGVNDFAIKNMSNLMSAFTDVRSDNSCCMFKHNYSTSDTAKVTKIEGANFYTSAVCGTEEKIYVYDNKAVFNGDSEMNHASGFANLSYDDIKKLQQKAIFVIPCAFTACRAKLMPGQNITLYSATGTVKKESDYIEYAELFESGEFYERKFSQSNQIIEEIVSPMYTKTSNTNLDAYFKNSFFDNMLRGGMPIRIGDKTHYTYSRKHGDLEREYNWFNISATYYSSGSGNFRDVNQNRRNDIFFFPFLKDDNIKLFFNLIQVNGYNPLVIETPSYILKKDLASLSAMPHKLSKMLEKEFEIGAIAPLCTQEQLHEIVANSEVIYKAKFGEGYWTDHFTYNLDLIESYLNIYPDKINELLLSNQYSYYNIDESVLPISKRLVNDSNGDLKAFGSLKKATKTSEYLLDSRGEIATFTLLTKIIGLVIVKIATLDRKFVGIEMEAGKPGWNDAMNGLPALNASNVADAIELYRLIGFVIDNIDIAPTYTMLDVQEKLFYDIFDDKSDLLGYESRLTAREKFHSAIDNYPCACYATVSSNKIKELMLNAKSKLKGALLSSREDCNGLYPTFIKYHLTGDANSVKTIQATSEYLPLFLEAVTKSFKLDFEKSEHYKTHVNAKESQLYDRKLKLYKTSVPLKDESPEIGRVMTFHSGLYERESCFLHMHYKYLLGLLESELYDEFYDEIEKGLVCNFDPKIYKRGITQNSSFVVSSECIDSSLHGRGFQPRLTGANSEVLSMFKIMFAGREPFIVSNGELIFELKPILSGKLFDEQNQVSFKFLNCIEITYVNNARIDTYNARIVRMEITDNVKTFVVSGSVLDKSLAEKLRNGEIFKIVAYIQ